MAQNRHEHVAGEVGDPQPVRGGRAELTAGQFTRPVCGRAGMVVRTPPAAPHSGPAQLAHQLGHCAPGDDDAIPVFIGDVRELMSPLSDR